MRAMSHLVDKGLVLYWGTSEWSAAQLTEAYLLADKHNLVPPTMEQPEYPYFFYSYELIKVFHVSQSQGRVRIQKFVHKIW